MALILDFNAHAAKSCDVASRVNFVGSAEIVIFPGVRYQRWNDDGSEPKESCIVERDRIELPD